MIRDSCPEASGAAEPSGLPGKVVSVSIRRCFLVSFHEVGPFSNRTLLRLERQWKRLMPSSTGFCSATRAANRIREIPSTPYGY